MSGSSVAWRAAVAAVVGAAVAAGAYRGLDRAAPGGRERWERTSHSGRTVTLVEGPALVAGALAGTLVAGDVAGALAVTGAGVLGAVDDHLGATDVKGLRGHLGALRHGQVTTGVLKIAGLGVTGLGTATLVDGTPRCARSLVAATSGAVVVAGGANLANLLDLRPGRTLKAGLLVAAPLLGGPGATAAAAGAGACAALLPADLGRRAMLGDTGANALGALLGASALRRLGLRGRLATAGVLTALVLASERTSFTAVIEATPVLRELDALGRAPA